MMQIKLSYLQEAFKLFDKHGKGVVCVEELKDAMLEVMGEQLVNEMMQDADNNGNGLIDYDDFVNRVMQGK